MRLTQSTYLRSGRWIIGQSSDSSYLLSPSVFWTLTACILLMSKFGIECHITACSIPRCTFRNSKWFAKPQSWLCRYHWQANLHWALLHPYFASVNRTWDICHKFSENTLLQCCEAIWRVFCLQEEWCSFWRRRIMKRKLCKILGAWVGSLWWEEDFVICWKSKFSISAIWKSFQPRQICIALRSLYRSACPLNF